MDECEEARFNDKVFDGDVTYSPAHFVPADVVVKGHHHLRS